VLSIFVILAVLRGFLDQILTKFLEMMDMCCAKKHAEAVVRYHLEPLYNGQSVFPLS